MTGQNPNEKCWYCGCELEQWVRGNAQGSILRKRVREHQTPRSKGGIRTVLACFSCNSQKGTKNVEEYRVYLRNKFPTMKAANALREALPVLGTDFAKHIEIVASTLERVTPSVVFIGEKVAKV